MSAVIQSKTETDPRVEAAISHWAPRFVANGVPLADFQEVTASCERWEDWCRRWAARAATQQVQCSTLVAEGHAIAAVVLTTRAAYFNTFGALLVLITTC